MPLNDDLLRQVTCSVEIDRPPAQVWTWIEDPEKQKQWMKGVVFNEPVGEGRFRMGVKEGGRVTEYQGEVVRSDEPRHLTVRLEGGCGKKPMVIYADYRLAPTDTGTRVDYGAGVESQGLLFKVLGPLFRVFAKRQVKGFFKTLKARAEAA